MQKQRLFTFFLFLSFVQAIAAQYSELWSVRLQGGAMTGEDLLLHANGDVTICGTNNFTARFDALGNLIWQTSMLLEDPLGFCVKLLPTSDGGTCALGDYEDQTGTGNLMGLHQDASGTLLGTAIVNTPGTNTGDDFRDAAQDSEGNIYLTGQFAINFNAAAGLAKLDPLGNLLWQVALPPPPGWGFGQGYAVACSSDALIYVLARNVLGCSLLRYSAMGDLIGTTDFDIVLVENGNILAVDALGNAVFGGSHGNQFNMTKVLPNGAVLWSHDFAYQGLAANGSHITNILCDGAGNIYGSGSAGTLFQYGLLTKFTPAGTQVWADTTETSYMSPAYLTRNKERMLLHNDRLTLATLYFTAHLYEYDTLGNRLSRQLFIVDGEPLPRVNAMSKDDAGDLYVTGTLPSGPSYVGYIAKFAPAAPTAVETIQMREPTVYPVPCVDQLWMDLLPNGMPVEVVDVNGRIILNGSLQGGMLDVSVLPNGPYILRTPDGGRTRFLKIDR